MPELLLVAVAVALRLQQYVADRPFWLDEAMLATAITSRSLPELLLTPLPYGQVAPPGTLALLRACVVVLGPSERALRLVPLMAGVVTVLVTWGLARWLFTSRAARCTLIGLVALSPTLVYYSTEAKQYALDAAASVLLLHAGLRADGRGRVGLAVAGTVVPWLSHPAVLLLPGIGLVQAIGAARRDGTRAIVPWLAIGAVWVASFGALRALTAVAIGRTATLEQVWYGGFAPFPLRSVADLGWYRGLYADLLSMSFKVAGAAGPAPGLWWPAWLDAVLPALVTAGAVAMAFRPPGRRALVIVVVTALAALAASAAHRYPLAHRLLVFAVPLVFVLLAGAVEGLAAVRGPGPLLAAALAVALVALTVPPAAAIARHPLVRSDVRGALAYVAAHAQAGDQLATTSWSEPAVRFYRPGYDLGRLIDAPSIPPAMDATSYVNALRARGMLGRTWVVITHRFPERDRLLRPARALAPQLDAWEGTGAGAYLFDFGALPR